MAPITFRAKLFRPDGVGTWTFAELPKALSDRAGLRTHQRVQGTIDGVPFRSSLIPRGGGVLFIVVSSPLRASIGKEHGATVEVVLEPDRAPIVIEVPAALQRALRADRTAQAAFAALAPSHRKAFARWVASAKQEATRDRRVDKAIQLLRRGETLN